MDEWKKDEIKTWLCDMRTTTPEEYEDIIEANLSLITGLQHALEISQHKS